MSPRRLGALLAIATSVLWGTAWVATRFALESFDPTAAAAWRGLGAAALLGIAIVAGVGGGEARRWRALSRGQAWRLLALGALGGLIFVTGMNIAIQRTGATVAAFVAGLYPVLAAGGAPLVLRERTRRAALAGIAVAIVGVWLLAGVDLTASHVDGIVVGLVAAAAFAAYLLLTRRWAGPWHLPAALISWSVFATLGVGAAALELLRAPGGLLPPGLQIGAVLAVAWLAVPSGALAHLLVIGSLRRLPAQESSAYLLLNPLTAAVLAAPLLGERMTPAQLLGAACVLAGIGLATVVGARRAPLQAPTEAREPAV